MTTQLDNQAPVHWQWSEYERPREALFFEDGVRVDGESFPFTGSPISARLTESDCGALVLELRICQMPGRERWVRMPVPPGCAREARAVQRRINLRGHGQT